MSDVVDALRRLRESLGSNRRGVATIDDVRTSPPPSVLAPVDLTDPAQVAAVMTIAARIGSILIANGTTSSDARASIHTVTSSYGLHYCHIDITVNTMTIHTIIAVSPPRPAIKKSPPKSVAMAAPITAQPSRKRRLR